MFYVHLSDFLKSDLTFTYLIKKNNPPIMHLFFNALCITVRFNHSQQEIKIMKKLTALLTVGASLLSPTFANANEPTTAPESKGKILLVGSSVNQMSFKNGKPHPTGYYLGELATPAQAFIQAGYEVVVATPDGNTPALDKNSITESLFDNDKAKLDKALHFVLTHPSMQKPTKLTEAVKNLDQYDALYVPGGHAPMVDLMQDKELGKALRHFHETGKTTALLCHGPIALAAAVTDSPAFRLAMVKGDNAKAQELAKGWIYDGYNMTVYSTAEEKGVEEWLGNDIEFYMEDALRNAGGKVSVGEKDKPYIMVDRELITGQNPFSDHLVAEAVLKRLAEQKK